MTNILLAIAALGTIAALVLWILKRWWGKPEQIAKLKEEVDEITSQMAEILLTKPVDWRSYDNLNDRLSKLNRKIARISPT